MDFRKIIILGMMACLAFGFSSCKKEDDETEDYLSLSGAIKFDVDAFVEAGQTLHLVPGGVENPDGSVGWKWQITPFMAKTDTVRLETDDPTLKDGSFDFTIPDTTCTATISCSAFAEGYYTAYTSTPITIVKKGVSLSGIDDSAASGFITDSRDGQEYPYVQIGDVQWLAKNMSFADAGLSFADSEVMDSFFGRYYNWNEAQTVCPDGWRLPTDNDWVALASSVDSKGTFVSKSKFEGVAGNLLVNAAFNNEAMWEYWPAVKITNTTGLSMLPLGYASLTVDGKSGYAGYLNYAAFWTADSVDSNTALYRYIYMKYPDINVETGSKSGLSLNVRCVRDSK